MEWKRGKERITISYFDTMLGNREIKEKIQKGIEDIKMRSCIFWCSPKSLYSTYIGELDTGNREYSWHGWWDTSPLRIF